MTKFNGHLERIFGPPGTGKTTELAKLVRSLITKHGTDCLLVSSFAVTAAKEIAGRFADDGLRPPDRAIGTLHSHAFRSVGHGAVALDVKTLADWNNSNPDWRITPDTRRSGNSGGDTGGFARPASAVTGDELIASLDKLRATMTPVDEWPANVRRFAERWENWKREAEALDYTDMIEMALERARDGEPAPGNPQFFIADEAQDQTPLESALVMAWGEQAEKLYVGFDDDQAINRWRGGDPEPLLTIDLGPDGELTDRVLDQSYRVPESVRLVAQRWVERLNHRQEKVYRPRINADGSVARGAAYKVPESLRDSALLDRIESDLDAPGKQSVMVIASCNYMLEPLLSGLRARGIPFHNPFRPAEIRWNPLGGATGGVSTAERVYRYMIMDERLDGHGGRLWTGEDVQMWMEMVKLGPAGMVRGAKKMASLFDKDAEVPEASVRALFQDDETFGWAVTPDVNWLSQALLAGRDKTAAYPIEIVRQHGPGAISERPRLVVGTIHSVKGAAADIVYVAPDISTAGQRNAAESPAGRDELIRLFYVAMTRAYRELRLLQTAGMQYVERAELLPPELEVMPE